MAKVVACPESHAHIRGGRPMRVETRRKARAETAGELMRSPTRTANSWATVREFINVMRVLSGAAAWREVLGNRRLERRGGLDRVRQIIAGFPGDVPLEVAIRDDQHFDRLIGELPGCFREPRPDSVVILLDVARLRQSHLRTKDG